MQRFLRKYSAATTLSLLSIFSGVNCSTTKQRAVTQTISENKDKQTLRDAFNKIAKDHVKAFPRMERLVITSIDWKNLRKTGSITYTSPAARQLINQWDNGEELIINQAKQYALLKGSQGIAFHYSNKKATPSIQVVMVDMDSSRNPFYPDRNKSTSNAISIFYHELGHFASKTGAYQHTQTHIAESMADAYAVLLHEKYSPNKTFRQHAVSSRALQADHSLTTATRLYKLP